MCKFCRFHRKICLPPSPPCVTYKLTRCTSVEIAVPVVASSVGAMLFVSQ